MKNRNALVLNIPKCTISLNSHSVDDLNKGKVQHLLAWTSLCVWRLRWLLSRQSPYNSTASLLEALGFFPSLCEKLIHETMTCTAGLYCVLDLKSGKQWKKKKWCGISYIVQFRPSISMFWHAATVKARWEMSPTADKRSNWAVTFYFYVTEGPTDVIVKIMKTPV